MSTGTDGVERKVDCRTTVYAAADEAERLIRGESPSVKAPEGDGTRWFKDDGTQRVWRLRDGKLDTAEGLSGWNRSGFQSPEDVKRHCTAYRSFREVPYSEVANFIPKEDEAERLAVAATPEPEMPEGEWYTTTRGGLWRISPSGESIYVDHARSASYSATEIRTMDSFIRLSDDEARRRYAELTAKK